MEPVIFRWKSTNTKKNPIYFEEGSQVRRMETAQILEDISSLTEKEVSIRKLHDSKKIRNAKLLEILEIDETKLKIIRRDELVQLL